MTLSSKLLIWIMAGLIALSVNQTFWRTMVAHDFVVMNDVDTESDE